MNLGKILVSTSILAGLLTGLTGCELIASVDRSKIDGEGGTGGTGGGGTGGVGTGGMTGGGGAGCTVPEDDMNECTDDVCNPDGSTAHNPKAAGEACSTAGSVCDGNGNCVECIVADDCPGADDACQTRTCTMGVCGADFAPDGTAVPTQTAGDCKVTVCDGAGATKDNNDDADVPDDSNDCTADACDMGTPSNTDLVQGAACGANGDLVCDGTGQCIGCNVADDCAGADDECKTRTCVNSTCGVDFTPDGTPVTAQTDNDCLVQVCDGTGNVAASADDTDLPLDDGNACTDETCGGGMPMHPDKADGATCDDGDGCTTADTCQMGACMAGTPVTCMASDQCHVAGTCNPATGMCDNPNAADGTSCDDSNGCTQTDTCQTGTCTGGNPVTCMASDQCHVAGTCNPATGMCDNPNAADGTSCDDSDACTQTDTCQTGTCTGGDPVTCMASDQCHVAGTCDPATGLCDDPNAPDGTACDDSDGCTQTDTCQTGACMPGTPVTCMALDACHVAGTCSPATGLCDNPNAPDGTACTSGAVTGTCTSGTCEGCGDGVMQAGEQCDDGNTTAGDCCSPTCQLEPTCEAEPNNSCAAVNAIALSGSPLSGTINGAITPIADEDFYSFTLTGTMPQSVQIEVFIGGAGMCSPVSGSSDAEIFLHAPDCTTELGGDDDDGPGLCSLIDPAVDSFASNLAPGTYFIRTVRHNNVDVINDYDLVVTVVSACGNGSVEAGEACDDGNNTAGDGCDATCGAEAGFTCTGSPSVCTPIVCGNGVIEAGEQCDDGDMTGGDGCDASCQIEANFQCVGQPTVCTPFEANCFDGLDDDGDTLTDGADDDCVVTSYFPPCAVGQTRMVFRSTDPSTMIPYDPTILTSTINVTGAGTVQRAAIVFNITHPYVGDVSMALTTPGGATLDMTLGNGSFGDDFTRTVLDSTCSTSILDVLSSDAPFSECFAPEESLAAVNGTSGNGAWDLLVTDTYSSADDGTLDDWALILCTQ